MQTKSTGTYYTFTFVCLKIGVEIIICVSQNVNQPTTNNKINFN